MGAGNYFFNSPAVPSHKLGEEIWDKMLYIDLWDEQSLEGVSEFEIDNVLRALECDAYTPQGVELDQIGDAIVIAEWGRMVIACAHTYYGDRVALIVTPNEEVSNLIYAVENDGDVEFDTYKGECKWVAKQVRLDNLHKANLIKSIKSGTLHREMTACFDALLFALHEYGLEDSISFRAGAWCSSSYKNTQAYTQNELRIKRGLFGKTKSNLVIQGASHV